MTRPGKSVSLLLVCVASATRVCGGRQQLATIDLLTRLDAWILDPFRVSQKDDAYLHNFLTLLRCQYVWQIASDELKVLDYIFQKVPKSL